MIRHGAMRKKMEKYINLLMENELVGETALLNPYLKLEAIDERHHALVGQDPWGTLCCK